MNTAFYTGASGLNAFQSRMDVIGNNIANVNTNGYRPVETTFNDLLYTEMYVNSADVLTGHGVKTVYTGINAGQGTPIPSSGELDFAIVGNGWFAVESGGETVYTRDGSFHLSVSGMTAYLVNQNGDYVLDKNGRRISAVIGTNSSSATSSNSVSIDTSKFKDQIGVFNFANPEALIPVSSNRYRANELTGAATVAAAGSYEMLSGYLEQSGVSMPDEMINLIMAQRGYQLSARVGQTADEVEQTINSLRS
ncbi:MAG: flagellar hook-basal body protein [Clostridiales bacterium]|nr:flagellar hook-basal body protein [Clostridiales bacterium]